MKRLLLFLSLVVAHAPLMAQKDAAAQRAEYLDVVTKRADKIVAGLGIGKPRRQVKVRSIIANQYVALNDIYALRDSRKAAAKANAKASGTGASPALQTADSLAQKSLDSLHPVYLSTLRKLLNSSQVAQVKDGMTYGVLPNTYKAYQEMLPNLTEAQKSQILAWLTEAREHAMDAESSEKKHGWFGKYKGRINNYLSAAGIDMKQAGIDWQNRIKAQQASK